MFLTKALSSLRESKKTFAVLAPLRELYFELHFEGFIPNKILVTLNGLMAIA
jgi:hypothetical protein